jgi:hypothetical protein
MSGRMMVAVTALCGLGAMWVFPAPLLWGVLFGGLCLVAIVLSCCGWALGRVYDAVAEGLDERRRRQRVHRLSGIRKRTGRSVVAEA